MRAGNSRYHLKYRQFCSRDFTPTNFLFNHSCLILSDTNTEKTPFNATLEAHYTNQSCQHQELEL